jgi:hypothetical protein
MLKRSRGGSGRTPGPGTKQRDLKSCAESVYEKAQHKKTKLTHYTSDNPSLIISLDFNELDKSII